MASNTALRTVYRLPEVSPTEAAALKRIYLALMSLDPTGKGRKRWTMRWRHPSTPSSLRLTIQNG
ncbi:hypothetical protein ACWD4F_17620 [Streptomyces aureus]